MLLRAETGKELLLAVDGNALLCRSFFGLPILTDPRGRVVNGVYGFCKTLIYILNVYNPSHIVITFDHHSKIRKEIYPEYKANRVGKVPNELIPQFNIIHKLVDDMGLQKLYIDGIEGDDLIALIVNKAKLINFSTLILTGDKDLFQLLDKEEVVKMLRFGAKGVDLYTYKDVFAKMGCDPEFVSTLLALMGDEVDGIPGCRNIGEKTACKLISKYGNIENLYKSNLQESPKLTQRLLENKLIIEKSYDLAQLYPPELDVDIESFRFTNFGPRTREAFQELGFNSLLGKI